MLGGRGNPPPPPGAVIKGVLMGERHPALRALGPLLNPPVLEGTLPNRAKRSSFSFRGLAGEALGHREVDPSGQASTPFLVADVVPPLLITGSLQAGLDGLPMSPTKGVEGHNLATSIIPSQSCRAEGLGETPAVRGGGLNP